MAAPIKTIFCSVFAWLAVPAVASAAFATANVHMRVGPGTGYGIITTIPQGAQVDVFGCTESYKWCDSQWAGFRGWVYSAYLAEGGRTGYYYDYAPVIGIPSIVFSFGDYHDRHYRDRPWYRHRHWKRQRDRRERKVERRERRRDRVENRRERRIENRRELRRERGAVPSGRTGEGS